MLPSGRIQFSPKAKAVACASGCSACKDCWKLLESSGKSWYAHWYAQLCVSGGAVIAPSGPWSMWGVPTVDIGLESGTAVVGRGEEGSSVTGNVSKVVAVGTVKVADGETGETL